VIEFGTIESNYIAKEKGNKLP